MANKCFLIDSLKPTQLILGVVDVNRRATKIAMMSSDELEELLEIKSIPYVVGPKSEIYIVDHHHLYRALWINGKKNIYLGTELADLEENGQQRILLGDRL